MMEQNIAFDRLKAGFFSAVAAVMNPHDITDLIKKFWLSDSSLPAMFIIPFRLCFVKLKRCFNYNPFFYTPEIPKPQSAFVVSNSGYTQ